MIRIQLILIGCLLGFTSIHAQLVADFSANSVTGCAPFVVKFSDQSTGNPNYWSWGTSDGQLSRLQNPTFIFRTPGIYSVSLLIKDASGNFNSISKTDYITVNTSPNPGFNSNLQVSCAPANIQFNDISQPGQGTLVSWNWDFGDNTTSTIENPSHQYANEGYYNVNLVVTNSGGCSSTISYNRFIRVVPGVKPDFTWSQTSASCSAPFDIVFSNQTSGPGHLSYTWDLGNASTSTQVNPSTSYPTNSQYTINLSATSDLGCSGSTTKSISFQGNTPVIISADSACLNTPISFSNGSIPAPLSSTWDFGNGNTSTQPNPDNVYTAPTTYTVTLTNTYAGCTSSATKNIKVITNPGVTFTADNTVACKAPFTVNFKDLTPGSNTWSWNFGDGGTANTQNPSHTYTVAGTYTVSQSVTTDATCGTGIGTRTNYIQIIPPTATLDAASLQGCTGIDLHPTATILAPDGVASYSWSAPDATPTTSTAANPAFTFSTQGQHDITLSFTTNGGCTFNQTFSNAVTIGDRVNPVFTADNLTSCADQPITFTSSSNPVDKWLWKFGDGDTSQVGNITIHKFHDTGFFNVTLSVTHNGCSLSYTAPKYVYINGPSAGFTFKIDCANRLHVDFADTTKADPAKGPLTYKWDFGDGNTSTIPAPSHDYTVQQAYNVRLIVANSQCIDTITTLVDLNPLIPSFKVQPTDTCRYRPFTITNTTVSDNLVQYTWKVGIPSYVTDTPSIKISVPDTGDHTIVLTVKDVSGCTYSSAPGNIRITGPTAKFAVTGPGGCKNSPIAFTDNSVQYRNDAITTRVWFWGDNTNTTSPTPPVTHQYADTGTYNVALFVRDSKACTDTLLTNAVVKITAPKAGFLTNDTLHCPNLPIAFTDSSKGNSLTFNWDFGDGATDNTQNPIHTYTTNDQYYDVKLKVTDAIGCADSSIHTKYIHIEKPIASFLLEDSVAICFPLEALFTPTGKYYDSLYWDFGDGITSTLDTTSHFYNNYGPVGNNYAYVASLILQGAGGCRDTAKRNVYVYQPFDATKFTFSPTSSCDSVRANFNIIPPPFAKFTLFFGDGAADSSGNNTPNHLYDLPSTYSPLLSLSDTTGCIVPINNGSVKVLGATPFFSESKKAFCDTSTIFFHSLYPIPSNDGIASLIWDFGDGSTPITGLPNGQPDDPLLDQQHFYTLPGLLTASIKVSTNSGCVETYTDTVHVWQTPHPLITADGPFCTGLIQFHGTLTTPAADSIRWSWVFSNGATSTDQDPRLTLPPGSVTARLTTAVAFGCSDTTSQPENIFPLPDIKGPKVVTTPVGIPVTLPFTYSPNVTTYTWSPATNLDCTDCPNPSATPTFNTTYTVKVTDDNSCVSLDTVLVKTICGAENYFIPNTFSPNGDGVNDIFYPRGKGLYNIQSMRIFNRWGQLVYERKDFPANSPSDGWNGTINGRPASPDAYIYIIDVVCINAQVIALRGDITLIR